jgi:hypothetical protein
MNTILNSPLIHRCCQYFAVVFFFFYAGTVANAQHIKEGVVNVLIQEKFRNQAVHSSFQVNGKDQINFVHPVGKKIFSKYKITKYERTYPGIEKYHHPHAEILSRYYTIEGNFKRDRIMYDILKEGGELFEDVEQVEASVSSFIPNDYSLVFAGSIHLQQIRAQQAWDLSKGARSISVAVSDPNGFYFGHPDYVNSDGTNQIVYRDAGADDQTSIGSSGGAHGLVVASTVAAATNNNVGISALGYNTSLMAFDGTPQAMLSASYDHNAPIVVASWTYSCTYINSHQLIMDMIHDNGTVIIVAAGNGNMSASGCPSPDGKYNGMTYPASYNHVISVGSVGHNDEYAQSVGMPEKGHHSFNQAVDLTAPGWGVAVAAAPDNLYSYSTGTGTSVSAPMVAGLAALILSLKSDLAPEDVEFILKSTARNVNNVPGNEVYASVSGAGRIDAYSAVLKTHLCFACEDVVTLPAYDEFNVPNIPNTWGCKIDLGSYIVSPGEVVNVTATRQIRVLPGFRAMPGSNVLLKTDDICIMPSNSSNHRRRTNPEIKHISYQDLLLSGQIDIPEPNVFEGSDTYGIESYPNPANDHVVIKYTLESASHIRLEIQDLSGNSVTTLEDGFYEPGEHEVSYDISGLAPGVYFYVMKLNTYRKLGRLIVIR